MRREIDKEKIEKGNSKDIETNRENGKLIKIGGDVEEEDKENVNGKVIKNRQKTGSERELGAKKGRKEGIKIDKTCDRKR